MFILRMDTKSVDEFTKGKNAEEKKEGANEWALRKTDVWGWPEKEKLTQDAGGGETGEQGVRLSGRVVEGNHHRCPSPKELGMLPM